MYQASLSVKADRVFSHPAHNSTERGLSSAHLNFLALSLMSKPLVQFRADELQLLDAFVTEDSETTCPNVIVQGYKSVGKTHTVLKYLESLHIRKSVVKCDECITHKLLLQRCLNNIKNDCGLDLSNYRQKHIYKGLEAARISLICENFAYFVMSLEQFFLDVDYKSRHVLVLDRFDQCCDPTDELFAAFLKLQEYSHLRNLSVIFITSHEDPREIVTFSIPHIFFKPYSQEELVSILQEKQLQSLKNTPQEASSHFWNTFAKLVVDLFFDYTGSDVSLLLDLCEKLWPKFAKPVETGSRQPQDLLQIYRDLRPQLFNDNIISNSSVLGYDTGREEEISENVSAVTDLPYHSKFILIAAYLASYVEPKHDLHFFSRIKANKKKQKTSVLTVLAKADIDSRLLSAGFFDLERLKAILSVIYRNESKSLNKDSLEFMNLYHDLSEREIAQKENEFTTFTLNNNVDVNTQLSTLVSLGLISRTYASDILSSKIRWKCNATWDIVEGIAKEILFPMHSYLVDKY